MDDGAGGAAAGDDDGLILMLLAGCSDVVEDDEGVGAATEAGVEFEAGEDEEVLGCACPWELEPSGLD